MEKLYQTALSLAEKAQELTDELFKYNPSFEGDNGKKSLATLAGMARELKSDYEMLQIALIKKHEEKQEV